MVLRKVDRHALGRRTLLKAALGAAWLGSPAEAAEAGEAMAQDRAPATEWTMPPEDAPHERSFLQWPTRADIHGRRDRRRLQKAIALIADTISEFEPVVLLASGEAASEADDATGRGVEIWDIPTDDLWCRDSGPTFVKDRAGKLAVAHIRFNGWGDKQAHARDARIAEAIAARLRLPLIESGLVGEQGGVEHDGAGTLLAHASSWVNPNRSRESEAEIGARLMAALGGRKMIWTPGLIGQDITDYHIDSLARFVAPGRVLIQLPKTVDRSDPYSVAAYETHARLERETDADGRPLEIMVLPEPVDIRSARDDFIASYVNYYVCNGAVIFPQFGDRKADARAAALLASLYPGRETVALDVDALGEAGGGIHCATQQQPKAG